MVATISFATVITIILIIVVFITISITTCKCGNSGHHGHPGLGGEGGSVQQQHCLLAADPRPFRWGRGTLDECGDSHDGFLLLHHLHPLGQLLQASRQVWLAQIYCLPVDAIVRLLKVFFCFNSASDSFAEMNIFISRPENANCTFVVCKL